MEYSYTAYRENGALIKGRIKAAGVEQAENALTIGGYRVIKLKPYKPLFKMSLTPGKSKVKTEDVVSFSRQLALLIDSGVNIATALELLRDQTVSRALSQAISEVLSDIRGGKSLAEAFAQHPNAFPVMYTRAVAAGERGGSLPLVLRQMAEYLEKGVITGKKVRSALTYPVITLALAVAVVILLLTFVLPTFTGLYSSFGADLPWAARLLQSLGNWFGSYGLYLLGGLVVLGVGLYFYFRTPSGRYLRDRITLRIPVIGKIALLNELARACRTIALLFQVGIPLPEIMTLAAGGADNRLVTEALTEVHYGLLRGEGLSQPMMQNPLFLPLMVQMAGVGEETGKLDDTLSTAAVSFEFEADERTSNAVGLIQPAMTIIIGLVVGFLAITMFSMLYSLTGSL